MASGRKPVKDSVVIGIWGLGRRGFAAIVPPAVNESRDSARRYSPSSAISARRDAPSLANVLDVAACRLRRDAERVGDLGVGETHGHEARDRELAGRQRPPRLVDDHPAAGLTLHGVGPVGERLAVETARRSCGPRPQGRRRRHIGSSGCDTRRDRAGPRTTPRSVRRRPSRRIADSRAVRATPVAPDASATRPRPCSRAVAATGSVPDS